MTGGGTALWTKKLLTPALILMPMGLVPAIHDWRCLYRTETWMTGTSPVITGLGEPVTMGLPDSPPSAAALTP